MSQKLKNVTDQSSDTVKEITVKFKHSELEIVASMLKEIDNDVKKLVIDGRITNIRTYSKSFMKHLRTSLNINTKVNKQHPLLIPKLLEIIEDEEIQKPPSLKTNKNGKSDKDKNDLIVANPYYSPYLKKKLCRRSFEFIFLNKESKPIPPFVFRKDNINTTKAIIEVQPTQLKLMKTLPSFYSKENDMSVVPRKCLAPQWVSEIGLKKTVVEIKSRKKKLPLKDESKVETASEDRFISNVDFISRDI